MVAKKKKEHRDVPYPVLAAPAQSPKPRSRPSAGAGPVVKKMAGFSGNFGLTGNRDTHPPLVARARPGKFPVKRGDAPAKPSGQGSRSTNAGPHPKTSPVGAGGKTAKPGKKPAGKAAASPPSPPRSTRKVSGPTAGAKGVTPAKIAKVKKQRATATAWLKKYGGTDRKNR